MNYQIKPLAIAIFLLTSHFIAADELPTITHVSDTTTYQGGEVTAPIIEKSSSPDQQDTHKLTFNNTKISINNDTALNGMSFPAAISLGGWNGIEQGLQYGDLAITLDKDTSISVTRSSGNITGVYTETDSSEGVASITSDATIKITSAGNGDVRGILAQNFFGTNAHDCESPDCLNKKATLMLNSNSKIDISGSGKLIRGADAQASHASVETAKGSGITITATPSTGDNKQNIKGISSWGYDTFQSTSTVNNNGTITINYDDHANLASVAGIDSAAEIKSTVTNSNTITIKDWKNGQNTLSNNDAKVIGIKNFVHYGENFIDTSATSKILIHSSLIYRSVGIQAIVGENNSSINNSVFETKINAHDSTINVTGKHEVIGIDSHFEKPDTLIGSNNRFNSTINYDNKIGVISSYSTSTDSSGLAYGIKNESPQGDVNTIINNAATISATSRGEAVAIKSSTINSGNVKIYLGTGVTSIISSAQKATANNAAIYASSNQGDSTIFSAAKLISTSGENNHGIRSESQAGKSLVTTSSRIIAPGNNSAAIYSTTKNDANSVTVTSGANLLGGSGDKGAAVFMTTEGGNQELTIAAGASIASKNDKAIFSNNTSGITTVENSGTITGYAKLQGNNVTFINAGTLDLKNNSSGKQAVTYTIGNSGAGTFNNNGIIRFDQDMLDGTTNTATFEVANFNNNSHGIINLTSKNPNGLNNLVGDKFIIKGNYIANGGSIYLNTTLDNASSNGGIGNSDQLQVDGNVTINGNATRLYIIPTTNSLGGLTEGHGIKVIDVKGTLQANAFVLGRPLTAGAYEYTLNQHDMDWYLSSFYKPTGSSTGQILYNPAIGAYLANQTAAVEMFQQTLFDRLISASDLDHDATKRLLWLRTSMTHGSRRSVQANFSNRNRSYMMQLGGDLAVWQVAEGYLHVGLMAGYGDAKNTSTARFTRTTADGKVKGYSSGIYGTWFQNQDTNLGLYLDTWSQMGWYRNQVSGEAQISTKRYNSSVWSNSIEAGYGILLTTTKEHQWIAIPQVQLTYNWYDTDNLKDHNNLYVNHNKASGLETRSGFRLYGRALQRQSLEPFVEMNWLHATAKNQLTFNGDKLKDGLPQHRFEAKLGLQSHLNDKWSISAQVGGQWGQNHFNQYQGQLNALYKW